MSDLLTLLSHTLNDPISSMRPVSGGYTLAKRFIATGTENSYFIKQATDELTAKRLRLEHAFYTAVKSPYIPEYIAWIDCEFPILVLEDLSRCSVAPPWTEKRVRHVLTALDSIHALPPPPGIGSAEIMREEFSRWSDLAARPDFLASLRKDIPWLTDGHVRQLADAEKKVVLIGDSIVHMDIRSDNLLFKDDRAVIFDWDWNVKGHPDVDLGCWALHLAHEGGPLPQDLLPNNLPWAAAITGFFTWKLSAPTALPPETYKRLLPLRQNQFRQGVKWIKYLLGA